MGPINSRQFGQERRTWRFKLEHFRQENVLIKCRLSEMVDNNEGSEFLQMAELFQNEFLITDDRLENLLKSIEEFFALYPEDENEHGVTNLMMIEYKRLKNEIIQFERGFLRLEKEFYRKMSRN